MPSSEEVEAVSESLDETPLLWLLRSFLRVSSSTSSEKRIFCYTIEFIIDFGISDRIGCPKISFSYSGSTFEKWVFTKFNNLWQFMGIFQFFSKNSMTIRYCRNLKNHRILPKSGWNKKSSDKLLSNPFFKLYSGYVHTRKSDFGYTIGH